MLNPDMTDQELRLHMGEMNRQEIRVARAAIRWANTQFQWQPMETAPKDGTAIWIYWEDADCTDKDIFYWCNDDAGVPGWRENHTEKPFTERGVMLGWMRLPETPGRE